MAKISANGCYELARWQSPVTKDEKYPETSYRDTVYPETSYRDTVVLRSDGVLLRKCDTQHRPGERWSSGTYSIWKRFTKTPAQWRKLSSREQQERIDGFTTFYVEKRGWTKLETRPPQGMQLDRMYRKFKT
jgi:uncharacterized protein YbdZ (MbtH family)